MSFPDKEIEDLRRQIVLSDWYTKHLEMRLAKALERAAHKRAIDPPIAKFDYVTGVYQGGVKIA
jgi:hypothetical protein